MRLVLLTAPLMAAMGLSSALAEPVKTSFVLVGQAYNLTLPEGFCPPSGANEAKAKVVATAVSAQAELESIYFPCKAGASPHSIFYGVLAAPKATLTMALPSRAAVIAQMQGLIADGTMASVIHKADPLSAAEKAIGSATAKAIKLSGDPKFVETDSNGAYIVGVITAQADTGSGQFLMVAAMTVAKGRISGWYLYTNHPNF